MQETLGTWVKSRSGEDPLEEEMATVSSILAWRIPVDRGAWWATVHRIIKSWTRLSTAQYTVYLINLIQWHRNILLFFHTNNLI